MNKFSQKILDAIKEKNVKPKSRYYFICLNGLLILALVLSIIFGSIGIAILIRHLSWTDWELAHHFSGGNVGAFFLLLPYLWIGFILLALLLADQLFKHTKTGYRKKPITIISISILLSLNFGYILYLAKLDRPVEEVLMTNLPSYQNWEAKKNKLFVSPEMGVLAGRIVEISSPEELILVDFADREWMIDITHAKFKNNFSPLEGLHIGIFGESLDKNHFKAKVINLWKRPIFVPPTPFIQDDFPVFERNF